MDRALENRLYFRILKPITWSVSDVKMREIDNIEFTDYSFYYHSKGRRINFIQFLLPF